MREGPLRFNFYGVTLRVDCGRSDIRVQIKRDFRHFLIENIHEISEAVRLELRCDPPPLERIPSSTPLWSDPLYSVHDDGQERWVNYNGQALCHYDFSGEAGTLWCPDPALMHELAYLLIHSRIGEMLDKKGLHRVHALGFSYRNKGVLVLAPMGGGKTTLGMELLRYPGVNIFSDDSPLADADGNLYPFPLRFGVLPSEESLQRIPDDFKRTFHRRLYGRKILVDYEYFKEKISAPCKIHAIFTLEKNGSSSHIRAAGAFRPFFALFSSLVVGYGVPQIREYFLRANPKDMAQTVRIGFKRLKTARSLLEKARCYRLLFGPETESNGGKLLRFLETQHG